MTLGLIHFIIPGEAKGTARPRTTKNGHVYSPKINRVITARTLAAWHAAKEPTLPRDCHYAVTINSLRQRGPSHYLKSGVLSAHGRRRQYPGKPDLDNEVKGIIDALVSCGAIPDDSRMVSLTATKRWLGIEDYQPEGTHVHAVVVS